MERRSLTALVSSRMKREHSRFTYRLKHRRAFVGGEESVHLLRGHSGHLFGLLPVKLTGLDRVRN
ncbi:MAG: hypothetical protein QOG92_1779, partial [Verrucomicrobiota bacterium]|nr:hypothetical protein [Verrucomicrobiota bacterium]